MAVEIAGLDVETLKSEIKKTYARVCVEPEQDFIFPTGRAWAEDLDYPRDLLGRVPNGAAESFAGVANPFALGSLAAGSAFSTSVPGPAPIRWWPRRWWGRKGGSQVST
jgi:hypothetical protein